MSIDAIGYILGFLTIGMSMIASRYRNMLLTIGATALWVTLLNFVLANTTPGLGWVSLFIISSFTFMAAFALISFVSRRVASGQSNYPMRGDNDEGGGGQGGGVGERTVGMMEESNDEYRLRTRRALHPNRRRRR